MYYALYKLDLLMSINRLCVARMIQIFLSYASYIFDKYKKSYRYFLLSPITNHTDIRNYYP